MAADRARFTAALATLNAPSPVDQMLDAADLEGIHEQRRRFFRDWAVRCRLLQPIDGGAQHGMGPEIASAKIIHVAGTNGKGSVC